VTENFFPPKFQLAEVETVTPSKDAIATVIGLQADQPVWHILVVDDSSENRVLLTRVLT
jgi:hypothetical protein